MGTSWRKSSGKSNGKFGACPRNLVTVSRGVSPSLGAVFIAFIISLVTSPCGLFAAEPKITLTFDCGERLVMAMVYHPNGRILATAGQGGPISLWNPETGALLSKLPGHQGGTFGLAYSPDGSILASAGVDKLVRLWDAKAGKELRQLKGHEKEVAAIVFSPDETTLASGSYDGTIRLWNVKSGEEIRRIKATEGLVTALAFSPDGRRLASGGVIQWNETIRTNVHGSSQSDQVRLWKTSTGELDHTFEQRGSSVQFCQQGKLLLMAGSRPEKELRPNGDLLVNGIGRIYLINLANMKEVNQIQDRGVQIASSPNGFFFISGSCNPSHMNYGAYGARGDDTPRIWEVVSGQEQVLFPPEIESVAELAFSQNGQSAAFVVSGGKAYVCNFQRNNGSKCLSENEFQHLWNELAGSDSKSTYFAISEFVRGGENAVDFLRNKIPPAKKPESQRITELIGQLDDDKFQIRNAASEALLELDELAKGEMKEAIRKDSTLESRRRLQSLLESVEGLNSNPIEVRVLRAIIALEYMETNSAAKFLKEIADGDPAAKRTSLARDAWTRMSKRQLK